MNVNKTYFSICLLVLSFFCLDTFCQTDTSGTYSVLDDYYNMFDRIHHQKNNNIRGRVIDSVMNHLVLGMSRQYIDDPNGATWFLGNYLRNIPSDAVHFSSTFTLRELLSSRNLGGRFSVKFSSEHFIDRKGEILILHKEMLANFNRLPGYSFPTINLIKELSSEEKVRSPYKEYYAYKAEKFWNDYLSLYLNDFSQNQTKDDSIKVETFFDINKIGSQFTLSLTIFENSPYSSLSLRQFLGKDFLSYDVIGRIISNNGTFYIERIGKGSINATADIDLLRCPGSAPCNEKREIVIKAGGKYEISFFQDSLLSFKSEASIDTLINEIDTLNIPPPDSINENTGSTPPRWPLTVKVSVAIFSVLLALISLYYSIIWFKMLFNGGQLIIILKKMFICFVFSYSFILLLTIAWWLIDTDAYGAIEIYSTKILEKNGIDLHHRGWRIFKYPIVKTAIFSLKWWGLIIVTPITGLLLIVNKLPNSGSGSNN